MKFFLIATATLVSMNAFAGTVLKFQTGVIDPQEMAQTFLADTTAQDYVLQFHSPITEADKALLKEKNIQVFRYVPEDSLIVRASSLQLQSLKAQSEKVRAFIPYVGQMKFSDHLPVMSVFSAQTRYPIYISTFTANDGQRILETLQMADHGLQVLDQSARGLSLNINLGALPLLSKAAGVEYVEQIFPMEALHMTFDDDEQPATPAGGDYTDLTGTETGTQVMGFESAWAAGYNGAGETVAMADTGMDSGDPSTIHKDFAGVVAGTGYSFGIGATTWDDPMGHGTHVAGSVLGRGTMSGGQLKGGAFAAKMVPQGMWSPLINNLTVPPKLVKLFDGAYKDGARVHTNSWGSAQNFGAYDSMAQQVDEFMWNQPEFLVLYAAGNSGADKDKDGKIDPGSLGTPATAKNALTVGASENYNMVGGIQKQVKELRTAVDSWPAEPIWSSKLSDNTNGIACFSSRGPTKDGRLKPDVVAPGTNILSVMSQVQGADPMWGLYNQFYTYAGGTSMATPLTAGAAAVTRQVLAQKFNLAHPSAALVKATLMHTAKDLFPGQYGQGTSVQELTQRPNTDEGYGRVDMDAVSKMSSINTAFVDNTLGVATSEAYDVKVTVRKGQSLLVNMVYTDAPGTPTAAKALVNDIDLLVTSPSGQVTSRADSINNAEFFEAAQTEAGTYLISVKGTNVPMGKNGKQPFALVYTVR